MKGKTHVIDLGHFSPICERIDYYFNLTRSFKHGLLVYNERSKDAGIAIRQDIVHTRGRRGVLMSFLGRDVPLEK